MRIRNVFSQLKIDEETTVEGWLCKKRDHGGLLFWEIRKEGETLQIVFNEPNEKLNIPIESIVKIKGKIILREQQNINPKSSTGNIELIASEYKVISKSEQCPFYPNDEVSEELKSLHRVLYLRSDKMQNILLTRSKVIFFTHQMMQDWGFIMVQTPLLTVSSPEGARDFIVPSRLHKGKFYALPQAPQIFKQLLMCGGLPRYYQVAPCFRDEAARSTRLYGEFYQLDFEMSFVQEKDVTKILEEIVTNILMKFSKKSIFHQIMTYHYAIENYGSDKPDLRNPLKIEDFTEIFSKSSMDIFKKLINNGSFVKGIRVQGSLAKAEKERYLNFALKNGFRMAYVSKEETLEGPIAKFLPENICKKAETIFFICDNEKSVYEKCHIIREHLGIELKILTNDMQLVTVLDFPMFEIVEGAVEFKHNPFSKIKSYDFELEKVIAHQYDLVLNGYEIASGSIRENNWNQLIENFIIAGHKKEEVEQKFRSLIQSFKYSCPPHGGAAIGIERLLMILLDEANVRETVAFPLNTNGQDPLCGAPSFIEDSFLQELDIKLRK